MKQTFKEIPLVELWCSLVKEYPKVYICAVLKILRFSTAYLYKVGFSRNKETKSIYRHRLNVAPVMSIHLSTIFHKFARPCATNKQHKSLHY